MEFRPPPKPRGLLLLLFKVPIYLYKLHLEWILGERFLMLEHVGRHSGKLRQTVLEVAKLDEETGERFVMSGYGKKADWYRNISAKPAIRVRTARTTFVPEQRFLRYEERYRIFSEYEQANPDLMRKLLKLVGVDYDGTEDMRREMVSFIRIVALRPTKGMGPA